ncbi:MAG TPA: ABC transporter permease [Gemmataceae bacterium]|nr:ABC transporter permease [Gemmataceae bacterium]
MLALRAGKEGLALFTMRRLYSLKILWHGRHRFLPAVLAVSFSAVLIAVQFGVLLGTLAVTSRPIDHAPAQIWVGIRDVPSIELGHPIPESWMFRVQADPEIEDVEGYLYEFTYWHKPAGGSVHCCIIGTRLGESALGAVEDLTPEMRTRLTEPGSVVVDRMELDRLGLTRGVGETAEVMGRKVRVVGLVNGFKSIWGPYVFCSMQTARMLLFQFSPNEMQYLLARSRPGADVPSLVERLRRKYPEMAIIARHDFSIQTRLYWLTRTRVGIALGLTSVLALIVGLVITSQTLYAATAASLREYAVLRALGLPRWRISALVLAQSFWIGLAGVATSLPMAMALARLAGLIGAEVPLPPWLLAGTIIMTMIIALLSGLLALRSLRLMEPANLLR